MRNVKRQGIQTKIYVYFGFKINAINCCIVPGQQDETSQYTNYT